MIPLRRALIVKEHGNLPYPEGTACADVLIAGEKGGDLAGKVFLGLGIAFMYKAAMSILDFGKKYQPSFLRSSLHCLMVLLTVKSRLNF